MSLNWDEKTAVYLSLAEPKKVWMLLDTFTAERFARILGAKLGMVAAVSEDQLEGLRQGTFLEVYEREVCRDSQRCIMPVFKIGEGQLDRLPPLVRIGYLLRQLRPTYRDRVLSNLEPSLAQLLRKRMEQRWNLTPEARNKLFNELKFDPELFDRFAQRAPVGVAEWLLDKAFFGIHQIGRLAEISPLTGRAPRPGKGRRLRLGVQGESGLSRGGQLAIVLMSLPPEVSAQLFKQMGPEMVHAITLEISKLPPISPELREQVIAEVTALSPEELEAAVREQAEPMGEYLRRYYADED